MFKRRFILNISRRDPYLKWTLVSRYGRVVSMGVARSILGAKYDASKHLPRWSRIAKVEFHG